MAASSTRPGLKRGDHPLERLTIGSRPDRSPRPAFKTEIKLLEKLALAENDSEPPTVGDFLIRFARIGGYLNRLRDAPPGNLVR